MYVIIENGENPLKYTSENIELVPDGVKIEGDIFPCSIVPLKDNDEGFSEIHISTETYYAIMKKKGGISPSKETQGSNKTEQEILEKKIFDEYFTPRFDKLIQKVDDVKFTDEIFYFEENNLVMNLRLNSFKKELYIDYKLWADIIEKGVSYHTSENFIRKFIIKKGYSELYEFNIVNTDPEYIKSNGHKPYLDKNYLEHKTKVEAHFREINSEKITPAPTSMATTKDYLNFFEESTKNIIKRTDTTKYRNTEFWFIDDTLIMENHPLYKIFWFNTDFFVPLFELKYQLGQDAIKEIFDVIIPKYFGLDNKKLTDSPIYPREEVSEFFNEKQNEPEKFVKIYRDIQSIEKKDGSTLAEAMCKLAEEFGELAQVICKSIGRKNHNNSEAEILDNVKEELADVIQNCMFIGIKYGIDPYDLLDTVEVKNIKWKKLPYLNQKPAEVVSTGQST